MMSSVRAKKSLAALVTVLLAAVSAWCAYTFAHVAEDIAWDCGGGSCATNDPRSLSLAVALFGTLGACVAGAYAMGLVAPAASIAATSLAFRGGMHDAVAAGAARPESISTPLGFTTVGLVIAGLCLICWVPMFLSDRRLAHFL